MNFNNNKLNKRIANRKTKQLLIGSAYMFGYVLLGFLIAVMAFLLIVLI